MHCLIVVTAFLASMSAAVPTPAGGSLSDLIVGTASLAETDCTGVDEGAIAASEFICEEGSEVTAAGASENNEEQQEAGDAAGVQDAGNNNNNAQISAGNSNSDDAQDTAGDAAQQDAGNSQDGNV